MMEASELMIGDLVRVNKDVCFKKGTIVRVHAIDGDRNFPEKRMIGCVTCVPIDDPDGFSGGVWTAYLDPIPLTADILKNNGFDEEHNVGYVYEDGEGNEVVVDLWNKNIRVLYERNVIINRHEFWDLAVHKLQHVLKLCEIEKGIIV